MLIGLGTGIHVLQDSKYIIFIGSGTGIHGIYYRILNI